MSNDRMGLDYETFSTLNLTQVGSSRYSRHPSTEVLLASWSLNGKQMTQWSPAEGEPAPRLFCEAIESPDVDKWAWNTSFETEITRNVLRLNVDWDQWFDTMILAMYCSMPGKLESVGPIIDLPEDKQKMARGRRLITKFCAPRKPTKNNPSVRVYPADAPDDWAEFKDYNNQDETSERAIFNRLRKYMPPDDVWESWRLDRLINFKGVPFNRRMVDNAIRLHKHVLTTRLDEMRKITGLQNPNSNVQILPWLREHGYPFSDMKAGHVARADQRAEEEGQPVDGPYRRTLALRKEANAASPKKYYALERALDEDDTLRNSLQFYGAARTGRWAGRIFQPQNLPRPARELEKGIPVHASALELLPPDVLDEVLYANPTDLLRSCIRATVQAPDGYMIVDADLNAIENRVLGWLAQCQAILNVFIEKKDPYLAFAVYLFKMKYEDLLHEYKVLRDSYRRTIAKPGVLGCGYMLGVGDEYLNPETGEREATGLLGYAWNMGVTEFTKEQSKLSVETFRSVFSEVKDYWYGIEKAAKKCIRTGKRVDFGVVSFDKHGPFMRMLLPSGRALHYVRPRIEDQRMPWGDMKPTITYEGLNDKKQWVRQQTHPGKLTENADQAIARDILDVAVKRAERRGLDVRLHVHDQIVALAREDDAEEHLRVLKECMEEPMPWARDLPLGSAGQISKVFMKD